MKILPIVSSTIIALSVSTAALAQQAADKAEAAVEDVAQTTGDAVENAADNVAQTAETMAEKMDVDRPMLRSPANIRREGYIVAEPVDLTAERLTGVRVYGANDEDIGEIDELLLSEDGSSIDRVVIDVGGFLGMGEHEVAVTMEELHIMRTDDGMDFRAYMDATEEELEAQPEYDG